MTASVSAAQIIAAVKILSTVKWQGMLAAFESQDTHAKIIDGLIAIDDAEEIAGVFFPPIAVIANDTQAAIEVEQLAEPFVMWLVQQPFIAKALQSIPAPAQPGPRQVLIGGHVFDVPAWEYEPDAIFPSSGE